VVNLAQSYPDAREDQSRFMKTRLGSTTGKYTKKKLLIGNTIQKSLLATLYVAEHATLLETADLFCWLELDSAFVAENLRAFARAHGVSADDPWFFASLSMGMKFDAGVGVFPHTGGGICVTREGLRRLAGLLSTLGKKTTFYPWPNDAASFVPSFAGYRDPEAKTLTGCAFLAGHWWDVMLGRCFRFSNVTAHPALEDEVGRFYFSTSPLPCRDHDADGTMQWLQRPQRDVPPRRHRLARLTRSLCFPFGFSAELHRFASCEPEEEVANADYWISPFAIGFHRYKNLSKQMHAYRVLYEGAECDWVSSYRPHLVRTDGRGQRVGA